MKSKGTVVEVTKERNVHTYAEMWHTSLYLLEKGIENQRGCHHHFMGSLIFTAFTLEAYLNHIGSEIFKCWNDIERLGPREKLNLIGERLGIHIDYGIRPWQVMKGLFGFRNDIAHGKSAVVKITEAMPIAKHSDEQFGALARTKWETYCTQRNALKAREDVERIVHALHDAGRFEHDYPFRKGFQLGKATVADE